MDDGRDLTPGDPLGDAPERVRREHPEGSLFHDPARPAPERPEAAYGGARVPPGAFRPRSERPPLPSDRPLAGFGQRALAVVLDALILGGAGLVGVVLTGWLIGPVGDGGIAGALLFVLVVLLFAAALGLLYAPLVMARTNGQTFGKLLAGCRVVRTDGRRVGFWWAAYREVLVKGIVLGIAAALTGGIAYLVNFLWPAWDAQNRALHDYVAGSRVVRA